MYTMRGLTTGTPSCRTSRDIPVSLPAGTGGLPARTCAPVTSRSKYESQEGPYGLRCRYEQGHSASLQRLVARATGSLASISAPAAARHAGPRQQHATSLSDEAVEAAETESMRALEWSAVLKQVACFCRTSAAAEQVAGGTLPRGGGPGECELLLQQTQEAREAGLSLDGAFDIRPAIEAAASGVMLSAKQLEGVASTLESAFAIKLQACAPAGPQQQQQGAGGLRYPALAAIARGISDEERTLLRAIRGCIQHGNVTNDASEALAAVRAERQANKEALRAAVDGWARALVAKGAAEPGAVSIVRNRFCVGVRAGRQGELPKGSVRLGASSTGATLYIEPAPCVPLNNAEVLLSEREEQEVARVLGLLSSLMGSRADQLHALVGAVAALDVVAARAGHSAWIGGVRPQVTDPDAGAGAASSSGGGGSQGSSCLFIPGARHPVLMQRGLPPLPQPPSVDDNRFERDFQAAPAWELRRVLTPEGPRPGEGPQAADTGRGGGAEGGDADPASLLPRPLDLRVPSGKAVVAITGPNTGGKTVTIKAAGLLALMAQHGLFLPCDEAQVAAHGAPRVAWFDRVLADIGDNQSLQQSLSTFSGHVRRIKQILSAATPRSLVLLDEVGSGTDPLEGAALARAVLDRLAGQSRLTLATTHHAELKRVADEDGRYVTVSMAFDTASLRPTYALLWGAAGASNALDIAETLGFDRSVVLEARQVARTLAVDGRGAVGSAGGGLAAAAAAGAAVPGDGGRESHLAGVARSLVLQLEDTREELQAAKDLRARREESVVTLKDTIQQLRQFESELRLAPQDIVAERDRLAAEAQEALVAFSAGLQAQDHVEAALRQIEQLIPDEIAQYRGHARRSAAGSDDDGEYDDLYDDFKPGDDVHIKTYGDVGAAKVVSVKGDTVTVRFTAFSGLMGNAKVRQRSKAFHRREVQRVAKGSQGLIGMVPQWRVAGYDAMLADIRRVIGETSEAERAAAAEAAARRSQQAVRQQLEAVAGDVTYNDLYNETEALAEELLQDYGDPVLNASADVLDEQELYDMDEYDWDGGPAWGGGRGGGVVLDTGRAAAERGGQARSSGAVATGSGKKGGKKAKGRSETEGAAGGKAGGGGGGASGAAGPQGLSPPPPQTDANTVDLVGQIPELAAADLEDALDGAAEGAVLYVRHGVGTGAVREAVRALLDKRRGRGRGRVREWKELDASRGEVTVVWL